MMKKWEECNLEEYINFIDYRGKTPIKTASGIRLITAKNVKLGALQLEPQEFINPNDYKTWMTRGIPNFGDVLFTTEAPLGNVAQIDTTEKLAFAQRIIVMQPKANKIDQTFLKYMLLSPDVRKRILEKGTGATVQGIKASLLKKIKISFPSLPEQQHIVSILDEAFAAIDQAKENLQRNLQNAKELFQSELNNIFEIRSEGWIEKKLHDIGETQTGNTPSTKEESNYGDYIPFIKPGHFKADGTIDPEESGLSEKGLKSARLFGANSILMVCIGATIGKTGFSEIPVTGNQQINALTPMPEFEAKFFYYALISDNFFNSVIHASSQATLPIINKSKWENLPVAFPKTKAEQQMIVRKLDSLSAETKKLEELYQQKLNSLEELKKSILQKAFSGELTRKMEVAL